MKTNLGFLDEALLSTSLSSKRSSYDVPLEERFPTELIDTLRQDNLELVQNLPTNYITGNSRGYISIAMEHDKFGYLCPDFYEIINDCKLIHATALCCAHKCLKWLLETTFSKEDIDRSTREGLTALHISAAANDFISIQILLEAGADPSITDSRQRYATHYAAMSNTHCLYALRSHSQRYFSAPDEEGCTPLQLAQRYHKKSECQFLRNSTILVDQTISSQNKNWWFAQNFSNYVCVCVIPRNS
ncbi:hypothetical protein Ciccas_003556 [Cichlidogyrus casuarinus]|uniref:Uncharacterized protein n=1 Tax=Cichlidogyrus casuarinus TaxID=1844966 RepID=A0ABD2QDZ0_9PLAT